MYSIGELAKIGQISVRTLRYYDEIDLLNPTEIRKGGRRYYNDDAFITLHYILTLRDIGFELLDIKGILHETKQNPRDLLVKRLEFIEKKGRQLKAAKEKVASAIQLFDLGNYNHISDLFNDFIKFEQGEQQIFETRRVNFNDKEQEKLANLPHVGDGSKIMDLWGYLLKDIKYAIDNAIPEHSKGGMKLARRWFNLTEEMYDGDWELAMKAWSLHQSGEEIGFVNYDEQAVSYIECAIYYAIKERENNE